MANKSSEPRPWEYGANLQPLVEDARRRRAWIDSVLSHTDFYDQSDINGMLENIQRISLMRVIDPCEEVRETATTAIASITNLYQEAEPANVDDIAYRRMHPVNRHLKVG